MPDIELERLRLLRRRAEVLLSNLNSDLKPFCHDLPLNGFCRKPDSTSDPDDVNVTTTCSCLMSLALADKLGDFYADKNKPGKIFKHLLQAPWMSSGLAENNAFTTTLIIRLFGFLVENGVVSATEATNTDAKAWETELQIKNFSSLIRKLVKKNDPLSEFLFDLLPRAVQKQLSDCVAKNADANTVKAKNKLIAELGRLIRTTAFYEKTRFKHVTLSVEAKRLLNVKPDGYSIPHLNRVLLHDYYPLEISPLQKQSLKQIANGISKDLSHFGINEYPPSAAVIYWFIDGIRRAQISLPPTHWDDLCDWAAEEFARQRSLVVAKHAAMMDPVAMAMSACLCARLRIISNEAKLGTNKNHHASLPTIVELERSIKELFGEQTVSGIWPKYFPLFHYQEAGSNFCFTFELIEALLVEFGSRHNSLIHEDAFVDGLERAVTWCEKNRLRCSENKGGETVPFNGWNSGGFLATLKKGQPESWSTAVVHMFLWELVDVLSRHIQHRLLDKYKATFPTTKWKKISDLLDIEIWMDDKHTGLKKMLSKTIIKSFRDQTAESLRKRPQKKVPLSALLFGPPGTSKTEVTRAVASELNWPLVEIDPSHFLQESFEKIYVQAEKIFQDISDFSGVVILFDEMDALVQKRDAEHSTDTESKFLTTYMLPKLAKLHDRGQVVFFMATNFQANFDDAIKRAGRFDFLFCMGPPTLKAKCDSIHIFYGSEEGATEETNKAGINILKFAEKDAWIEQQLELYTFGEFKSFITGIGEKNSIGTILENKGANWFVKYVKEDSKSVGLKFDQLEHILVDLKCKTLSDLDKKDFDLKKIMAIKSELDISIPVIKYILDRKQSRRQCARLNKEDAD